MKIENSSAFPPCFSGEIKANDGTLFSGRAGWAEGPSNTPATQRARVLKKLNETESGEIPQLLRALFANSDFVGSANNDHSVTMFRKDR